MEELDQILENTRTLLEKIMMELNPMISIKYHRQYLGGYIDCLNETGQINHEIREILYLEYC